MAQPSDASQPALDTAQLQAELAAHKEKTAKWKAVVRAQLEEAAQKNERLRADLAAANARVDAAAAEVRLQLTAEFKERTTAKDDDINRLEGLVRTLRAAAQQAEAQHRASAEKLEAGAAEQLKAAAESQRAAETARAEAQQELHEAELEKERRKHDATRVELRAAAGRIEDLTQQVAGFKKAADAATSSQVTAEGATSRHAAELAAVEQRLAERDAQLKALQARAAADAAKHEQGVQGLLDKRDAQYRAELARREEQLHVINAMLSRARDESAQANTTMWRLEQEAVAAVDAAQRRVSTVTTELGARVSQVQQLQHDNKSLGAAKQDLERQLADAVAESASRELAFTELFERDFNKDGILRLEKALAAANEETEAVRSQLAESEALRVELDRRLAASSGEAATATAQVDARLKHLATREEQLRDLEKRVQDNQLKLAQHAQHLQQEQAQLRGDTGRGKRPQGGGSDGGAAGVDSDGPINVGTLRFDPLVSQMRAGRLLLETQGTMLFHRYRRFLPLAIVVVLLTSLLYVSSATPTASNAGTMRAVTEQAEALTHMRRQYDATLRALVGCEAACPAAQTPVTRRDTAPPTP